MKTVQLSIPGMILGFLLSDFQDLLPLFEIDWMTRLPQFPVPPYPHLQEAGAPGAGEGQGPEGNLSAPIDQQRIVSCRYKNVYQNAVMYTDFTIVVLADPRRIW